MTVATALRRSKKKVALGPKHDGRRMSLDDFDNWPVQEGYFYELGRGIIQVSNVPLLPHGLQVQHLRNFLGLYQVRNPKRVQYLATGSEAKLLIGTLASERHPDLLVYLTAPPRVSNTMWKEWIPDIVVEVVSQSSAKRDYDEKPQEYLEFGVREYWIVDAFKKQMTVMQRFGGGWRKIVVRPGDKYATALLPKFTLDLKKVLAVAK